MGAAKNSQRVISRPSQSFLTVETVVLRFRPLIILFTVDCVTPLMVHRLFIVICRSLHSSNILLLTASPISNRYHLSFRKMISIWT